MSLNRCPNNHPPGYRVNENDEKMFKFTSPFYNNRQSLPPSYPKRQRNRLIQGPTHFLPIQDNNLLPIYGNHPLISQLVQHLGQCRTSHPEKLSQFLLRLSQQHFFLHLYLHFLHYISL